MCLSALICIVQHAHANLVQISSRWSHHGKTRSDMGHRSDSYDHDTLCDCHQINSPVWASHKIMGCITICSENHDSGDLTLCNAPTIFALTTWYSWHLLVTDCVKIIINTFTSHGNRIHWMKFLCQITMALTRTDPSLLRFELWLTPRWARSCWWQLHSVWWC